MPLPSSVVLRDVSLRDGLQDEQPIATEAKLAIFEALVASGIRDVELTSFVRPDRVPAMADAEAFCAATRPLAESGGVTRWGLVLNGRGAERALAAGLTHLQYVVSVSDTHSRHNAGVGTDDGLVAFERVAAVALDAGAVIEMTLATAMGCPFEHRVDPDRVVEVARRSVAAGASSIGLADTIGVAVPTEVAQLVERTRRRRRRCRRSPSPRHARPRDRQCDRGAATRRDTPRCQRRWTRGMSVCAERQRQRPDRGPRPRPRGNGCVDGSGRRRADHRRGCCVPCGGPRGVEPRRSRRPPLHHMTW